MSGRGKLGGLIAASWVLALAAPAGAAGPPAGGPGRQAVTVAAGATLSDPLDVFVRGQFQWSGRWRFLGAFRLVCLYAEAFLRPFVSSLQRTGRWQPHAAAGKHASNPGLLL